MYYDYDRVLSYNAFINILMDYKKLLRIILILIVANYQRKNGISSIEKILENYVTNYYKIYINIIINLQF